jgi:Domain of unknown function (DUF4338)
VELIRVQGRTLSRDDLAGLRALIAQHPDWHRTAISLHLCELWDWRNRAGCLKDMAARSLLLKLHARGMIELPPARRQPRRLGAQAAAPLEQMAFVPAPISGPLNARQPVALELAHSPGLRRRVRQLLAQYHYRGFNGAVGENVQYLAREVRGEELAVMVFGAAAWKVAQRDRFIGWSVEQRCQHLEGIANQQRFLILPWVRVAHLASHLLALATRRLSQDWQSRYGHPVYLAETFVEAQRFAATAYKAAGWIYLGQTTGRTRQDRHRILKSPPKAVWVRALHPRFRQHLIEP